MNSNLLSDFRIQCLQLFDTARPSPMNFLFVSFLRKGKQEMKWSLQYKIVCSSVEIAVGTSINTDMIKEHYNLHIVILSLLMKVNIRMTFPSTIRLHKNVKLLRQGKFSKVRCVIILCGSWWLGRVGGSLWGYSVKSFMSAVMSKT